MDPTEACAATAPAQNAAQLWCSTTHLNAIFSRHTERFELSENGRIYEGPCERRQHLRMLTQWRHERLGAPPEEPRVRINMLDSKALGGVGGEHPGEKVARVSGDMVGDGCGSA